MYRRTGYRRPDPLLSGIDATVHSVAGRFTRRSGIARQFLQDAEAVDKMECDWTGLSDHDLRLRLHEFREQFRRGGEQAEAELLPALAGLREAAHRKLGLRAFPVQLAGALALYRGKLVEMATGEGKTLTAGLAAALSGWNPQPTHVITVNDYLVKRDAEWLGPFYRFCGASVGYVVGGSSPDERRAGHACDITYTTSKELLADFLRDRLRMGGLRHPEQRLIRNLLRPGGGSGQGDLVLRGLHSAIVDEADSVLIDEAVTPLIISAPKENKALENVVSMAARIVSPLEKGTHYRVDQRYREIDLTDAGRDAVEEECENLPGIWRGLHRRDELIQQALVAREFFLKDKQYVVVDGKIVIVDEFTGRQMPQRSWRQGMHQAIEAKEGIQISHPTETTARLSFQRFFRFFEKLSGMTGTANEAADEFWRIYRLPVVRIPTNKRCIRQRLPERVFVSETEKWAAIVEEIKAVHASGRPILVGTRSVNSSQKLADLLKTERLNFQLLNAVHHLEEAQIVADAGQRDRITIATNMAGRGTDIKLGKGVSELGGLHVIGTERHESGRVDRQLFGRSGRQGDAGSARMFSCLVDELPRRHLNMAVRGSALSLLKSGFPMSRSAGLAALKRAQSAAERFSFKQRKSVLATDTWMEDALAFTGMEDV